MTHNSGWWKKRRHLRRSKSGNKTVTDFLVQQINVAIEGIDLANEVCSREADAQESRSPMKTLEHEGDDARASLVERMALSLTVPLEREDLFRASRSVDDVLDNARDLVREMAKWQVPRGRWSKDALVPARESLKELGAAVLASSLANSRAHCLAARKAAGRLRRQYQNGLSEVFDEEFSMNTLKKREILRRIDIIGLRLSAAADALLDGIVKRSL